MTPGVRVALLVFTAAILQVSVVASLGVLGGTADILLVTLVSVALLRGSLSGAVAGFGGGLLVDVATLGTLGVNALLLTVAGFWAGRYGETTGRERGHAPLLAVVAITLLFGVASYVLHFMIGEEIAAQYALVTVLLPTLGLNLLAGAPIHALCASLLEPRRPPSRAREVELVV